MRVVRGGHFWQFGSIASLATETTDGEVIVPFSAQTWPQKRSQCAQLPNFTKNFPGGGCPQTPLPS